MKEEGAPARMRLPRGYVSLRPDLGRVLGERRRARAKQQTVADQVRVARETLSRIEAGRASPRPDTLERLMLALDLDWDAVAVRGEATARARVFHDTFRGGQCQMLGRSVRVGRERLGLSLRFVAGRCSLSASQLSRLERGEVVAGRAFKDVVGDGRLPHADRRVLLADPFLERLSALDDSADRHGEAPLRSSDADPPGPAGRVPRRRR